MNTLKIGDKVRYNDINLKETGTLISIAATPRGGDCTVLWDTGITGEEALVNLVRVAK